MIIEIRKILETKEKKSINGFVMDVADASLICSVYDEMNGEERQSLNNSLKSNTRETIGKLWREM